jgi:methyl coenzyme M reductase subunit C
MEDEMGGATLDYALDVVMQLPSEQQDMLIDIVTRRKIEAWREEAARDAKEAIAAVRRGELKPEPVEDIIARLRANLEEAEE